MAKMESPTPPKKTDVSKIVMIVLIIILLGFNVYQSFLKTEVDDKNQALTVDIETKDSEIDYQKNQLDSLGVELQAKYEQIAKLGGDTATLGAQIRQLAKEKAQLRRSLSKSNRNKNEVYKLQRIKKNYEELLLLQDKELLKLRSQTDSLFKESKTLKTTLSEREDSISNLQTEAEKLNNQVELGRILKADNFKVVAVNSKGKERFLPIYKEKHINSLKIEFSVAPNKIALVETKTVYMQLKEPSGNTLYDLALGSGEFENKGSKLYYTLKKDVIYERDGIDIEMIYDQPTTYQSGKYTIEVYCEGNVIGSGSFLVK